MTLRTAMLVGGAIVGMVAIAAVLAFTSGNGSSQALAVEAVATDPVVTGAVTPVANPIGLTAAPAAPAVSPAELAFGAYQRGLYLEALAHALDAAEAGNAASQTLIGILYSGGLGVPENPVEAAGWFTIAANNGDRAAQYFLGLAYLDGSGVTADPAAAKTWFEAAAAQDQPDALYQLGLIALGNDDPQRASAYFGQAAEFGVSEAMYALAQLYIAGDGVFHSEEVANRWLGRAADAGLADAQLDLGIRVFNGIGVAASEPGTAAELFRQAAENGNPAAQTRYARLLATGIGVAEDPVQAGRWYLAARAGGLDDPFLADYFAQLTPEQQAAARAAAGLEG